MKGDYSWGITLINTDNLHPIRCVTIEILAKDIHEAIEQAGSYYDERNGWVIRDVFCRGEEK